MGIWNIFGRFAISDDSETIHKVSETTSVSSNGTVYTTMGPFTHGSDGSEYTQAGSFNSDGSTRMGSIATGLGAVFIKSHRVENADGFSRHRNMDLDDFS
jgi:hypothetical protein